jgi:hypothetical protein
VIADACRHSLCLQADGTFAAAWSEENHHDADEGNSEDGDGLELEEEEQAVGSPQEVTEPRGAAGLGAFFEEDDEEEGGVVTAGGLFTETQDLLELYELAGYQIPRLAGPDCFTANDITFGQGLIIPTQEAGGWMPAIPIIQEMLNTKSDGLYDRFLSKAIQKWRVNKPLRLKTGIELAKGAVPLCEALATLRDVATEAHQGCKKTRFLAQQNNGLPYICCSVHHATPEYNFVRIPGWLVAATSTLCLQGYFYPEHKDKWLEVLCDNRRLVLMEYIILWNVYSMNDIAAKVNRPELRLCPQRLVGGAAASIQAKADDKKKLKAITAPKSVKKKVNEQQKLSFSKSASNDTPYTEKRSVSKIGKGSNKKSKPNVTPIKMGDLSEAQREAAFSDYMAKQGL